MAKLTKSDVFTKSHQAARILGYTNFPKILTDVWTSYYTYSSLYPSRKHSLNLKDGMVSSFDIVKAITNVGFHVEETGTGHCVSGTDFFLHGFKSGKVKLTKSAINTMELKMFRHSLLQNPKNKERGSVVSQIAINNDGYRLLSNGDIETTSGFIIPAFKGFKDIYIFPASKSIEYDQHCLAQSKEKTKSSETIIQASLISFWNTLTRSKVLDISVDYEVGVHSGEKKLDYSESRYDLVTCVNEKYELIELKKGVIDIATLNYKIGQMKMGVDTYCTTTKEKDSRILFVGASVDHKLINLSSVLDKSKIKLYSFKIYINRLQGLLKKASLNIFDEELATLYLNQLKEQVQYDNS